MTLKPDPVTLPCPAVFETSPDCAPFNVKFALPSGAKHTLHVLGCAPDRLAEPIRDEASLWPREFCVLRYTVTPALPGDIQLQPADRSQGDPPRRLEKAQGSVVIGGAAAVIHKWIAPAMKLNDRVKKLEEHSKNDYEALSEIKERDSLIMETLVTMLNSQISGNNVEQLKKTRDKLISYLAQTQ